MYSLIKPKANRHHWRNMNTQWTGQVHYGQRQSHAINSQLNGRGKLPTPDLIKFPSHLNCELNGRLNTIHEGHWELAMNNRREEFFEKLRNWSTQAINNELRNAITPNFQFTIPLKTMISKAYKGGMKYAAQIDINNTTDPQFEIVWRDRMTRPHWPMFCVLTSFASCAVCV